MVPEEYTGTKQRQVDEMHGLKTTINNPVVDKVHLTLFFLFVSFTSLMDLC